IAGGVAGGAVAGLAFGEKKDVYAFAGVCRQRTSTEAEKKATTNSGDRTSAGGGIRDQDTGATTRGGSETAVFERADWNLKTRAFEFPFMFSIAVAGGALSNKGGRQAAARETFLKSFPRFVTGGTSIGG